MKLRFPVAIPPVQTLIYKQIPDVLPDELADSGVAASGVSVIEVSSSGLLIPAAYSDSYKLPYSLDSPEADLADEFLSALSSDSVRARPA